MLFFLSWVNSRPHFSFSYRLPFELLHILQQLIFYQVRLLWRCFFMCLEITDLSLSKSATIWSRLSQTVSSTKLTSKDVCPSSIWYMTISPLFPWTFMFQTILPSCFRAYYPIPHMYDAWQSVPITLTVLTNVCADDAHILLDKYVNTEFFLIFSLLL